VDPPLPPNGGSLTVGYGSGGGTPKKYNLREGQDIDIGFMKLFLSDRYVDLSKIPQESPFSKKGHKRQSVDVEITDGRWATSLITIIQYRQGFRDNTLH